MRFDTQKVLEDIGSFLEMGKLSRISLNKVAKKLNLGHRGKRKVGVSFNLQEYEGQLTNLVSIVRSQTQDRNITVNGNPWIGLPTRVETGTSITVEGDLKDGEYLYILIDGIPTASESNSFIVTSNSHIEDVAVIRPVLGGKSRVVLENLDESPIRKVIWNPVEGYNGESFIEDTSGNRTYLTRGEEISFSDPVIDTIGTVESESEVPKPVLTRKNLHLVRRGYRAFRSDKFEETGSEKFSKDIDLPIGGTVKISKEGELLQATFKTPTEGSEVIITPGIPKRFPKMRVVFGKYDSKLLIREETKTINGIDISIKVYSGNGELILSIEQLSSISSSILANLVGSVLEEEYGLESSSIGTTIVITQRMDSYIDISGNAVGKKISRNTQEVIESTVFVEGGSPNIIGGEVRFENEDSSGVFLGRNFIRPVPITLSSFRGESASLDSGNFEILRMEVRSPIGEEVLNKDSLSYTVSGSFIYLRGKIPETYPEGTYSIQGEYVVKRTDPNVPTDNYDEQANINLPLRVSKGSVATITYEKTTRLKKGLVKFDIYSEEESILGLNKELRDLLVEEGTSSIIADITYPDGSEESILEKSGVTLRKGWNSLSISSNLFMVPMEDRGPFSLENDTGVIKKELGEIEVTDGKVEDIEDLDGKVRDIENEDKWIRLGDDNYKVSEVGSAIFLEENINTSGQAFLIARNSSYRRFANRFYQIIEGDIGSIAGPIFYISGSAPIPTEVFRNTGFIRNDFRWGFILGDLDEFRTLSDGTSCEIQGPDEPAPDNGGTLLLPVPGPLWGRWLADARPLTEVSVSDIEWNVRNETTRVFGKSGKNLSFSKNAIGEVEAIDYESVVTISDWPTFRYEKQGTLPTRGELFIFRGISSSDGNVAKRVGAVQSSSVITDTNNKEFYEVTLVTLFTPIEPGQLLRVKGDIEPTISHFLGEGPAKYGTAGYEVTYEPNAPKKLLLEFENEGQELITRAPVTTE